MHIFNAGAVAARLYTARPSVHWIEATVADEAPDAWTDLAPPPSMVLRNTRRGMLRVIWAFRQPEPTAAVLALIAAAPFLEIDGGAAIDGAGGWRVVHRDDEARYTLSDLKGQIL